MKVKVLRYDYLYINETDNVSVISYQKTVVQNKLVNFFILFIWLVLAAGGDIARTVS